MGQKGDKHTNEAALSVEVFVEKLSMIKGITSKKMFGGHGIFCDDKMFGIVDSKGNYYLKVDNELEKEYVVHGAQKHGKMPYYQLLSDMDLITWAKKSIEIL